MSGDAGTPRRSPATIGVWAALVLTFVVACFPSFDGLTDTSGGVGLPPRSDDRPEAGALVASTSSSENSTIGGADGAAAPADAGGTIPPAPPVPPVPPPPEPPVPPPPPACTDECSSGQYRCLSEQYLQQCGNYDGDSCLEWGGNIDCYANGQACSGNVCLN